MLDSTGLPAGLERGADGGVACTTSVLVMRLPTTAPPMPPNSRATTATRRTDAVPNLDRSFIDSS